MTIKELYEQLQHQSMTSFELLQKSEETYTRTKHKNPIACLSPLREQQAKQTDQERSQGNYRGLLHGIPLVIKDNILYADGTPTTANSYALSRFIPQANAPIVQRLLDAGAVILGKANLSEFAYFMGGPSMPSGYGSMYGQVKHPVDESIDPYGSSTGSAVAVALGIVPAAIGTETNGSLMAPAFQCQIVSLKPTVGLVDQEGIIPISPSQDTAGPMATNVYDCAVLMDVIVDEKKKLKVHDSYVEHLLNAPHHVRIGIVSFSNAPYSKLEEETLKATIERIQVLGWSVNHYTIELPKMENFETLKREFKVSLNAFLHAHSHEGSPHHLAEVIAFNEKHAERCLRYGQDTLLDSQTKPDGLGEDFQAIKNALLHEASKFDTLLHEQNLDMLITPTWLSFAPIYGNPSLCLPCGYQKDGPTGIILTAKKNDDARLMQLGHHLFESYKALFVSNGR